MYIAMSYKLYILIPWKIHYRILPILSAIFSGVMISVLTAFRGTTPRSYADSDQIPHTCTPPGTRSEKHHPVFLDHDKQLLDLVRLGHPLTILEGHDFLHAALFVDDV